MDSSIKHAPAKDMRQVPAGGMRPGDCMLDESEPVTRAEMVTSMIKRLNRLLGYYSKDHEERLAADIIHLIEHGIKKGAHNDLMTRDYVNKLATGRDILKQVYLSAKNITLEFGMLMHGGAADRERSINVIWVLRLELKRMDTVIGFKGHDHLISEDLQATAAKFIKVMTSDIDKFCNVHGIEEPQPNIVAPPSTRSPE